MEVTIVHQIIWCLVVLTSLGISFGVLICGALLLKVVVADPARAMNLIDCGSQIVRYLPGLFLIVAGTCGLAWVFAVKVVPILLPPP